MVLQDTWLFHGTIRENIAYGRLDATEEEIVAAAEAAHVDHFVRTLPDGYDTVIDDDATNLSAGEKQLLTIARAFLADPPILILDEATSSVDTRTEVLIQRAMARLMQGRTTFVIAHRLSTIRDADTILVMDHGRDRRAGHPRGAARARAASTTTSTTASSRRRSPRRLPPGRARRAPGAEPSGAGRRRTRLLLLIKSGRRTEKASPSTRSDRRHRSFDALEPFDSSTRGRRWQSAVSLARSLAIATQHRPGRVSSRGARLAHDADQAFDQGEVHPADQRPVLVDERVEGAVAETDLTVVVDERLVAPVEERRHDHGPRGRFGCAAARPRPPRSSRPPRRAARAASLSSRRRAVVRARAEAFERLGEEPRRGLVAPLRERDADLARRAAVELRRPPGAGPGPARQSAVLGDEQAVLDEAVEVERGERSRDAGRGRGLVPPDGAAARRHPLVQGPPGGLVEGGDGVEIVRLFGMASEV